MSSSYQYEIPESRINITLDVETGGAKAKKELPMKLLMVGDFSHGQAKGSIANRERLRINKQTLDQVVADVNPTINLTVKNCLTDQDKDLAIQLEFKKMADFKPDNLIQQIPVLKKMMAMRNLLKDLKACIIDNQTFRKSLEQIMKTPDSLALLKTELSTNAPLNEEL